jgi:hypothetical protein
MLKVFFIGRSRAHARIPNTFHVWLKMNVPVGETNTCCLLVVDDQESDIQIPIIFLSSADDKGLIVRALESGGVDRQGNGATLAFRLPRAATPR